MEIIDNAPMYPGVCAITGTDIGPFLDTQKVNAAGERIYIAVEWLLEAGVKAGLMRPQDAAAIEELEERAEDGEEAWEELRRLRESVRVTLLAGAVEFRDGEREFYKLRPKPGQRAVEV